MDPPTHDTTAKALPVAERGAEPSAGGQPKQEPVPGEREILDNDNEKLAISTLAKLDSMIDRIIKKEEKPDRGDGPDAVEGDHLDKVTAEPNYSGDQSGPGGLDPDQFEAQRVEKVEKMDPTTVKVIQEETVHADTEQTAETASEARNIAAKAEDLDQVQDTFGADAEKAMNASEQNEDNGLENQESEERGPEKDEETGMEKGEETKRGGAENEEDKDEQDQPKEEIKIRAEDGADIDGAEPEKGPGEQISGESAFERALANEKVDFSSDSDRPQSGSESDSDSSNEESDSDSDSDSESDDSSDEDPNNGPDHTADLSDDETSMGPLRTVNEAEDEPAPSLPEDLSINENTPIQAVGELTQVVERTVVVKAGSSGEFRVLRDGASVLCFEDRTLLGVLYETFGQVNAPFYSVKFNSSDDAKQFESRKGQKVFYVVPASDFVLTREIKLLKGSDASNVHDEEIPIEEQEYSNDEEELAQKSKKRKRKAKNQPKPQHSTHSTQNTHPQPPHRSHPPGHNQGPGPEPPSRQWGQWNDRPDYDSPYRPYPVAAAPPMPQMYGYMPYPQPGAYQPGPQPGQAQFYPYGPPQNQGYQGYSGYPGYPPQNQGQRPQGGPGFPGYQNYQGNQGNQGWGQGHQGYEQYSPYQPGYDQMPYDDRDDK